MDKVEDENDESWLYGNSEQKQGEKHEDEAAVPQQVDISEEDSNAVHAGDDEQFGNGDGDHMDESSQMEDSMKDAFHDEEIDDGIEEVNEKKTKEDGGDEDDLDDDSDDDDINIVIGDIKSGPSYNLKQRRQEMAAANAAGNKQPTGKFNIEEFESVGLIAGVPAHEFSIDSLEEKPWRKPGADITDYFNYGFNEDTWRAYCERQKRFRVAESGVGLAGLSSNVNQPVPQNGVNPQIKRLAPMRRGIDVVGGGMGRPDGMPPHMKPPTKENVIQVMTADRREYSRMNRSFDMNEPGGEPNFFEETQFDYMNYEPTQDSQWQNNPNNWGGPTGVKDLTPGIQMNMPPPRMMGPPGGGGMPMGMNPMGGMGGMNNMPPNMNMNPQVLGVPPNMNNNAGPRSGPPVDRGGRDRNFDRNDRGDNIRDRDRDRRRRSKSRSRERSLRSMRPRSRSRDKSRRPRSRSREKSRRPRSKSRDRRRTRSPTQGRERNKSRDRDARRSKSRDRKKDKDREPKQPKEEDRGSEKESKREKDSKERDHKKDKKKKKDKEKSDTE